MKINSIGAVNSYNTSFGRQPNAKEMQIYKKSVEEGLKVLNKKLDIIIHNSAAPSLPQENTGIGSLFSRTTQTKLIPFLKSHGFTGIQQEPNNLRKGADPSPYAPESSAKNIFMIPLEKLTSHKYGQILPENIFNDIVKNTTDNGYVDYSKVGQEYDRALRIAYENFKEKNILSNDFKRFKSEHKELERDAIYHVLSQKNNSSWEEWNRIDKILYSPSNPVDAREAAERINFLKNKHKDDINYFYFQQFILELENIESNKLAQNSGVKIIGDSPVAMPAAEEWINQNLLLKGKAIGCPPDYFSPDGQDWGFKYFNPKYIFNPDGTLGKAGKLMKEKYDSYFASFPGGLRIDHTIGLVDPFIYTVNEKMTPANSGRIFSIDGEFKKKKEEYSNILEEIVLKSAKEHNMDKESIICEDLGEPNLPTIEVMKKLDLSGIGVTQFDYRGKLVPERNVIMIGSHDNQSFLEYVQGFFGKVEGKNVKERTPLQKLIIRIKSFLKIKPDEQLVHFMRKTKMLAEDTAPANSTKKEIKQYKQELRTNKEKFIAASFAELFTSPAKRAQLFFTDFWGIPKTYNTPGTKDGNWIIRIGNNFEKDYYKAVSEGKAPNIPQSIAIALRQRGLDKTNPELMENLDSSAKILSEA